MSNATYAEVAALDPSSLANALYARDFASKTDAQVATTLVSNLGLTEVAGLNNWIAAQLTAAGSAKGAKIVELLNSFAQMTADATYGTYATAFNAKVGTALSLSQTSGYKGGDFVTGPAVVIPGATFALTTNLDNVPATASNDTVTGVISTTATSTTFSATDVVIDTTSTDADTFTLTVEADVTATNTGLVRGFETVNVNANATTLTDTNLDFAATNFAGVKTFNFDVTKPVTAVNGLVMTALDINNATVNTSDDFSSASVAGATGKNLNVNANAVGSTGSPTTVTVTGAMGDVTVVGQGQLSVTSNASTGLLSATAAKGLTLSGTAAQIINATATGGNLTISDATASLSTTVTATGDITISKLDAAGKLTATAGGTITLAGATANSTDVDLTSATLSSVGASSIADADALATLTLSGNGGKATYTMTAGAAALTDVNVIGASDVVLKVNPSHIETTSAVLNVNDSGSGIFNLDLSATAGTADLRGGLVDKLTVSVDNDSKVLSVKSGQVVTYKVTQTDTAGGTATTLAVGVDANASSNTVTIKLDDEVKDGNAVAITALTVTQAKTVTIDASADATAGGGAVTHNITTLTASGAKSNVTINAGANNIEFANGGATTVSTTGSIILTGSGTLTDAATVTSLTAGTLDASAMTGKVTLNSTTDLAVNTIRTGSKDDAVTLTSTTLDQTVSMGAGDDTLTLQALGGSVIVAIDLGDGTNDRLKFAAQDTKLIGTSVSLAGVETIEFANVSGQQIKASLLNAATYKVDATSANTQSVAVIVGSTDTTVDLGKLVGSTAVETAVAGMTFTTDANANTAAIAITGSTSAKNIITGSGASGDVLIGGTKADTFNYSSSSLLFGSNVMLDTIDGGTGTSGPTSTTQLVDAINFTATAANVTVLATDSFAKATSIESITTAGNNTGVISLTLGATAETAGIRTVSIAGDDDGTGGHTVNVAAFTAAVTLTGSKGVDAITGGAGNDNITGAIGADSLYGGAGDDTFIFTTLDTLFASAAIVDATISGGDGNDVISVGPATGGLTIANNDIFTKITGVESLTARANTGAVSISTDVTAYGLGFRTVNISAGTSATSNVIDVSETVTSTHGWTLIGSATGATALTGGSGNDTMSGGTVGDTFTGGAGNDGISLTAGGTDAVVFAASLTANGVDTITGFQVGPTTLSGYDKLTLGRTNSGSPATLANAADTDLVSVSAIASNALTITVEKVNEINLITTQSLSTATDGTQLLLLLKEANGGTAATIAAGTAATGRDGHIIAYADGNAYIYYFLDSATDGVVASEIALVGILNGVAPGGIEAGNIG
jgi:Ca2+-binding RTX toxin-like protein